MFQHRFPSCASRILFPYCHRLLYQCANASLSSRLSIGCSLGSSPMPIRGLSQLHSSIMHCVLTKNIAGPGQQTTLFSTRVRFDLHKNLPQDVLIYSHKNDGFYRILSYFGVFQMLIWGYVSLFSFQQLKTIPAEIKDTSGLPWWKRFLYKEGQYKNALSALSLIVGLTVLFITVTYPRRAIRSLWLLRGGEKIKLTTYSWLGQTKTFTQPVEHVSCTEGRTGQGNHVPLKIKDKSFFFLLDKQGTFHNAELFDFVVGLKRKL